MHDDGFNEGTPTKTLAAVAVPALPSAVRGHGAPAVRRQRRHTAIAPITLPVTHGAIANGAAPAWPTKASRGIALPQTRLCDSPGVCLFSPERAQTITPSTLYHVGAAVKVGGDALGVRPATALYARQLVGGAAPAHRRPEQLHDQPAEQAPQEATLHRPGTWRQRTFPAPQP